MEDYYLFNDATAPHSTRDVTFVPRPPRQYIIARATSSPSQIISLNMSMQSSVGNSQVYNDGDQRNPKGGSDQQGERYNMGTDNAHVDLDSKDERSIANKLAAASKADREPEKPSLSEIDPTLPARQHGNEPSRGAQIDKQLQEEEQEELRRKGKA